MTHNIMRVENENQPCDFKQLLSSFFPKATTQEIGILYMWVVPATVTRAMVYHIRDIFDLLDIKYCGLVQTSEIFDALQQHPETVPDLITYIEEVVRSVRPKHKETLLPYAKKLQEMKTGSIDPQSEEKEEERDYKGVPADGMTIGIISVDPPETTTDSPANAKDLSRAANPRKAETLRPVSALRPKHLTRPSTSASRPSTSASRPSTSASRRSRSASRRSSLRGGERLHAPGMGAFPNKKNFSFSRGSTAASRGSTAIRKTTHMLASNLPYVDGPTKSFFGTSNHHLVTEEEMFEGEYAKDVNIMERLADQLEKWEGTRQHKEQKIVALSEDKEIRKLKGQVERKMGIKIESVYDFHGNILLTKKQQEKISLHRVLQLLFEPTRAPKEMNTVYSWIVPSKVLDEQTKVELDHLFNSFDFSADGSISFEDFRLRSVAQLANPDPKAENQDPLGIELLFEALGFSIENRQSITKAEFFKFYREVWGTNVRDLTDSKHRKR
jgi:Ca2+-binding EF-hand superfamily protein